VDSTDLSCGWRARLTVAGKRRAWELVRHHRLLELFLHDVLKYSWDEVHDEAERLEHFISERFEDRVAAILGDPEIDPHGHWIPQKHESGSFQTDISLNHLPVNTSAIVSSASDRDPAALREIERLGLRLGRTITVKKRNFNASITAKIRGEPGLLRIAKHLAESVFVRLPSIPR
jgi:DtxR family transcriptional regulator, Mn-dependent transcriptional regulator